MSDPLRKNIFVSKHQYKGRPATLRIITVLKYETDIDGAPFAFFNFGSNLKTGFWNKLTDMDPICIIQLCVKVNWNYNSVSIVN